MTIDFRLDYLPERSRSNNIFAESTSVNELNFRLTFPSIHKKKWRKYVGKIKGRNPLYNFRFTVEIEKSQKNWRVNAHEILAEMIENWNNRQYITSTLNVLALTISNKQSAL